MDVRGHSTLGEGHIAKELAELFICAHGELDESRLDRLLLVILRGVARKLKNFRAEILEYTGDVDASADVHLVVDVHRPELTLDSVDRKGRTASHVDGFLLSLASGLHRSHLGHLLLRFG